MIIREATAADWPAIQPFYDRIVEEGDTYVSAPVWMEDGAHVVVALLDGKVAGTARMGPNRPGRGSHIATASFMVGVEGKGVGFALGEYLLGWARREGYRGIQFNAVVETNRGAVHLWQKLGFRIVGTIPGAFLSRTHGYVGLHVMFIDLSNP